MRVGSEGWRDAGIFCIPRSSLLLIRHTQAGRIVCGRSVRKIVAGESGVRGQESEEGLLVLLSPDS